MDIQAALSHRETCSRPPAWSGLRTNSRLDAAGLYLSLLPWTVFWVQTTRRRTRSKNNAGATSQPNIAVARLADFVWGRRGVLATGIWWRAEQFAMD